MSKDSHDPEKISLNLGKTKKYIIKRSHQQEVSRGMSVAVAVGVSEKVEGDI